MGNKDISVLLYSRLTSAYKIVLTILLLSIAFLSQAQDTTDVKRIVSEWTTVIPPTAKAQSETEMLMNAYYLDGEFAFDDYLDRMDDSWYSGIDLYINSDMSVIVDVIEKDTEAQFKINRKSCITIARAGDDYLVVVYSFP